MKIEKGMYVRTNYGIAQIIDIEIKNEVFRLDKYIMLDNVEDYMDHCTIRDIVYKPSFHLCDLIKPDDFVNGYRVTYVYPNLIKVDSIDIWEIHPNDIKTILTKEQYEYMCCEVKHES